MVKRAHSHKPRVPPETSTKVQAFSSGRRLAAALIPHPDDKSVTPQGLSSAKLGIRAAGLLTRPRSLPFCRQGRGPRRGRCSCRSVLPHLRHPIEHCMACAAAEFAGHLRDGRCSIHIQKRRFHPAKSRSLRTRRLHLRMAPGQATPFEMLPQNACRGQSRLMCFISSRVNRRQLSTQ